MPAWTIADDASKDLEKAMSDYRQQQEDDELHFFLWSSLNNLRGHISAEVFQAAEQQLGFDTRESNHGCVQENRGSFGSNGAARN